MIAPPAIFQRDVTELVRTQQLIDAYALAAPKMRPRLVGVVPCREKQDA